MRFISSCIFNVLNKGENIGRMTNGYEHFLGLYIDDFIGMLPAPGHVDMWRAKDKYPVVSGLAGHKHVLGGGL